MTEIDPMQPLDDWISHLCRAVDLDPGLVDRDAVLDLAGDAAHAVVRPAAPVTTYVVGVLVGRAVAAGVDVAVAHREALRVVNGALSGWDGPPED